MVKVSFLGGYAKIFLGKTLGERTPSATMKEGTDGERYMPEKMTPLWIKAGPLIAALMGLTFSARAAFSDLSSMLEGLRPIAAVDAPALNTLITTLDGLPLERDAILATLSPLVNRWQQEGWQQAYLGERLIPVAPNEQTSDVQEFTHGGWGQLLGHKARQRKEEAEIGYDSHAAGAVVGYDWQISPRWLVGLAGGFQYHDVTPQDLLGSQLDMKRLQGLFYGRYQAFPFYLQSALGLAHRRYASTRRLFTVEALPTAQAEATFSAWETQLQIEKGYVWKKDQWRLIPKALLDYTHIDLQRYTEKGADSLNLTIQYDDVDQLLLGVGGQLDYYHRFPRVGIVPEFYAYFLHDVIRQRVVAKASMQGGGEAFLTEGALPSANYFKIGAGLTVHSYRQVLLKLQYTYTARARYATQQALVQARYEWF